MMITEKISFPRNVYVSQKKKKRKEKKRKEKEKPNSVNKNAGSFEVLQLDLIFSNKVNNWPCLEQKQKQLDGTSS